MHDVGAQFRHFRAGPGEAVTLSMVGGLVGAALEIGAVCDWAGWRIDRRKRQHLAHHRALRHHDLGDLQRQLMRHGLSPLGRLEARVLVTLKTVLVTLRTVQVTLEAMLRRKPLPSDWPGSRETFFQGETRLGQNTRAVLGGSAAGGIDLVTLAAETARETAYILEIADVAQTWSGSTARMAAPMIGTR
jgi:hypothetical protein